jgi:hypothetical protein
MLYEKFEEMKTGVGETDIDTAKSAVPAGSTMNVLTLVLLEGVGSVTVDVTVAELRMTVPEAVPVLTCMLIVRVLAVAPLASVALYVQTMGPALPLPGFVQFQLVPA